ncbi:MAG: TerB family tellurite resistance protein [Bacteroidales bacterium]
MRTIIIIVFIVIIILIFKRLTNSKGKQSNSGTDADSSDKSKGNGYAKWIGGGLGWAFGGPIGGILGFAFGKMFEDMNGGKYGSSGSLQTDFKMSLLVLTAAVMKADGTVKKSELDYVKNFYFRNFGGSAEQYILMLREILKQEINVREVSLQVGQYMDYPSKLQILHYLFGISKADDHFHPSEIEMINQISAFMGISASDLESIRAMFFKDVNSAYKILELSESATDEEVKKAYREMAVKYHPDKVGHLGEEVRKAAEEKIQEVNAAYEQVKKQRGFK